MTTIYWAGDSTVKENSILTYPQTGMGQVFGRFVRRLEVRVENHAENGRSTKSFLEEGRLETIRERMQRQIDLREQSDEDIRVVVGMATCGIAAGARPVLSAFLEEVSKRGLQHVAVTQTGCIGVCRLEPIAEVYVPGEEKVTYVKMTPEKAVRVVNDHLVNGNVVTEYTIGANAIGAK